MRHFRGGKYRDTEVRALVEQYATVQGDRDTDSRGMRAIIAVADLKMGWRYLASIDQKVLLLVGVLGVPTRDAAEVLEKSQSWVTKRYRKALEELAWLMNGGIE